MPQSARRALRILVIGAGPTTVFAHLPVLAKLRDQGRLVLAVVCVAVSVLTFRSYQKNV